MKTIKGPAIFLAQFVGEEPPFNNLKNICDWAASLGYKGIQIPTNEPSLIDIKKAAESQTYSDEIKGTVEEAGLQITELATHIQGQLVAVHPSFDTLFDSFAPEAYRNNPKARTEWAIEQLKYTAKTSNRMGLTAMPSFSGALLWPTMYPWPQRPQGLVKTGFKELAQRWKPILDYCDEQGVDVCYEIHPGEDLHDGVTYERFLEATGNHERACLLYDPSHFVLQCLDYLDYIDIYHEKIKAFHVKDAEFNATGRSGVYGGYQDWIDRPGRFRSLGDGQVDFKAIFSKLTQYDFDSWAVLEWECCMKHPEDGAREGAQFIKDQIIRVTERAFDDFAGGGKPDEDFNQSILGLK
ncbi:MAG TPA: sugar phosphate isomerase/epimerase family protein [Chitinophagaceae bacterium]|nr:sugar phosphate isomerase/epimerase family protein [Chitinophagaceae bacterium]